MRTIIFLLLCISLAAPAQRTDVFIRLTDTKGQPVKGEAVMKGFERTIQAITFSNGGTKNNTQVSFTMIVGGASADLKRAMANNEFLSKGDVTVLAPGTDGVPSVSYTIKMENITVLTSNEAMGCNNVLTTTVTLRATRIGWTYYNQTARGTPPTVSRKFGWDADAKADWTNF